VCIYGYFFIYSCALLLSLFIYTIIFVLGSLYVYFILSTLTLEFTCIFSGLIDFLVSSHPIALVLREHITFKIVPMMNPDGVFLGNYR
jgi:hypothetical protein